MTSLVLRRQVLIRFVCFLLLVAALAAYVGAKRWDFQGKSLMEAPLDEPQPHEDARETLLLSPKGDFFTDSRLERERAASREIEVLQAIARDLHSDAAVREEAERRLMSLGQNFRIEKQIEGLVTAKGFDDALAFITEEGAVVTVKAHSLEPKQVAQVADIAMKCLGTGPEKVSIIARWE